MGDSLAARTAVITGASSAIGEQTARALVAEGAAVALLARRADRIEGLAAEITVAGGAALAGVMLLSPFDAGKVDEWRRMMDTNPTGVLLVSDDHIREGAQGFYDSVGALHAEDIAAAIAFAVGQPHRVSLNEIHIRPTGQAG